MPKIIPIRDLKNTSEISELAHKQKEPIFVTKNGYGDLVVMSEELYEQFVRSCHVSQSILDQGSEAEAERFDENYQNTRVGFLINGAKQSRYNSKQWFRYLRKYIKDDSVLLSPEEINAIIESGELTMYQTVTLRQAMTPGTPTYSKVSGLNKKTTTPMVKELMRRKQRV